MELREERLERLNRGVIAVPRRLEHAVIFREHPEVHGKRRGCQAPNLSDDLGDAVRRGTHGAVRSQAAGIGYRRCQARR